MFYSNYPSLKLFIPVILSLLFFLLLPLPGSVWDKVIAGSCAVLAYVVVAILLSLKRQLLLIKTASDITKLLNTVCLYPQPP